MSRIKRFLKSIRHAEDGLLCVMREQNFQLELIVAAAALLLSFYLQINRLELSLIVLVIVLVLILETINTIFECVIDVLEPRQHPYAKAIKDMMAGAVLLACLGSIIIGILIFLPYLTAIKIIF